ncbi:MULTISPECIES: hypothetical protein [Mycobacterium]|nr:MULTISPECIES: hypothetical protein [Mycobacterium]BDE16062.1 hypothetical protein MKCMC460_49220 [Mycobacterium sp. 20KCMC460]GLB93046.1 hypothetical protein SRL2020130_58630 [Mycobacterium kiyosense]GLC04839.1 hypothetical protein SRL2020400_54300 [Mycobacterium kiyosense]GLC11241.1 hypothetical protein SRL2020411_58870 [Mycobacterium kiyosense]GLC17238.1 hypothetical protein SRL2020448_58410 [Mycobacterium kiyosense]
MTSQLLCTTCAHRFGRRALALLFTADNAVLCTRCANSAAVHRTIFPGCPHHHTPRNHGGCMTSVGTIRRNAQPPRRKAPRFMTTPHTAEPLVPLALVAAELDQPAHTVAARIPEHTLTVDPATGLRAIPAHVCRELLDARAAAIRAEHEQAQRRKAEIAAVAAQQPPRRGGVPARPHSSALSDLMEADQR